MGRNLILLHLVQSCNYNCYYCTFKQWLKPLDYKFPYKFIPTRENPVDNSSDEEKEKSRLKINCITNEALLKWYDEYINPDLWDSLITGGEPSLYEGIEELIPALSDRGHRGIIQTNGSGFIPKTEGFKRTAAWHYSKPFPEHYDKIIIITNHKDDWKKKEQFCIDNKIPYRLIQMNYEYLGESSVQLPRFLKHGYENICTVYSMGQMVGCIRDKVPIENENIFNMTPPILQSLEGCPQCVYGMTAKLDLMENGVVKNE